MGHCYLQRAELKRGIGAEFHEMSERAKKEYQKHAKTAELTVLSLKAECVEKSKTIKQNDAVLRDLKHTVQAHQERHARLKDQAKKSHGHSLAQSTISALNKKQQNAQIPKYATAFQNANRESLHHSSSLGGGR